MLAVEGSSSVSSPISGSQLARHSTRIADSKRSRGQRSPDPLGEGNGVMLVACHSGPELHTKNFLADSHSPTRTTLNFSLSFSLSFSLCMLVSVFYITHSTLRSNTNGPPLYKYISFSRDIVVDNFKNEEGKEVFVKRELRFIDSFRFMPSSLYAPSKNLSKDKCKNLGAFFRDQQKLDLLLRKEVYPYDYVDSINRLKETELPAKTAFYSKLNDADISDEDHEHARTVWTEFGRKTLREYHDQYNWSDVLMMADVF